MHHVDTQCVSCAGDALASELHCPFCEGTTLCVIDLHLQAMLERDSIVDILPPPGADGPASDGPPRTQPARRSGAGSASGHFRRSSWPGGPAISAFQLDTSGASATSAAERQRVASGGGSGTGSSGGRGTVTASDFGGGFVGGGNGGGIDDHGSSGAPGISPQQAAELWAETPPGGRSRSALYPSATSTASDLQAAAAGDLVGAASIQVRSLLVLIKSRC